MTMKKILLFIAMLITSVTLNAQDKDVTKFLGIPVDGTKAAMIQKLRAKGFHRNYNSAKVLTGRFNGVDVNVHIDTNNGKVCRIMVCDANTIDETSIRIRFNILCEQFTNNSKYFNFSGADQKIPDDENISYEMTVNKKRYEALFYQVPDTTTTDYKNYKKEIQSLLSKYTPEQLENPSEEVSNDIFGMLNKHTSEKIIKKPVWFMISEYYGKYYITMFYDNEYNRANGEDL